MRPGTPYLDLLDDLLVQKVISCLDRHPWRWPTWSHTGCSRLDDWHRLSCCCRRLCMLVRRTRKVRISTQAPDVLQLLRAPSHRAFANVMGLELLYGPCYRPQLGPPHRSLYVQSVQEWGGVQDAIVAAVAAWPQLEELLVTAALSWDASECAPGCLSGIILALRHAPTLRRLELRVVDACSLEYVPVLTQLTHLTLGCSPHLRVPIVAPNSAWRITPRHLLAGMTNLVSLQLQYIQAADADACMLPPHLTRLQVKEVGDHAARLWEGIAACQQLQELDVLVNWGDDSAHPTLLRQTIAGQLTGLVQLQLSQTGQGYSVSLDHILDTMLQQAGAADQEEEQGNMWRAVVPLLGPAQGYPDPEGYVMVPPPNMGALTSLQHISTSRCNSRHKWWLVVSSERYWRALGGCSSLRSLKELLPLCCRLLG